MLTTNKKIYTALGVFIAGILTYGAVTISDSDLKNYGPIGSSIQGAIDAAADTNCDGFVDDEELAAFQSLPELERLGRMMAGRSLTIVDHLGEQTQ